MQIFNIKEMLMKLDRYMKAGRMTFSLLTADNASKASVSEIIIDYGTNPDGTPYGTSNGFPEEDGKIKLPNPTLYVRDKDGNRINIETESLHKIRKFMNNFLEVSDERTKQGEPSMWFKIATDSEGSNGFTPENVGNFYNYVKKNSDSFVPYILQTFHDKKRDILIPYVTPEFIYYDIAKLLPDRPDNTIISLDATLSIINNIYKTIIDNLEHTLSVLEKYLNSTT